MSDFFRVCILKLPLERRVCCGVICSTEFAAPKVASPPLVPPGLRVVQCVGTLGFCHGKHLLRLSAGASDSFERGTIDVKGF